MAISYVAKDIVVWEGNDEGHTFSFTPVGGLLDDDLLLCFFACTATTLHRVNTTLVDDGMGNIIQVTTGIDQGVVKAKSDDGLFDEIVAGAHSSFESGHIQVFQRVYDSADTQYDFRVDIEYEDGTTAEQTFLTREGYFVLMAYRGVATATPVDYKTHFWVADNAGGSTNVITTKTNAMLIQASLVSQYHPSLGAPNPTVSIDSAFTTRDNRLGYVDRDIDLSFTIPGEGIAVDYYYKYELEVGERLVTTATNYNVDYNGGSGAGSGLQNGYHAFLALIDAAHAPPDSPDAGTGPDKAGQGYMVWEDTDITVLDWEQWGWDGTNLVQQLDSTETPQCLGGIFYYDSVGSCEKAEAYFQIDPTSGSHDKVFRFLIDEPSLGSPAYYYSALAINSRRESGVWKVELVDLMNVLLDGPVGAISSTAVPTLAGVFPNKVELFRGKLPTITLSTIDEYQSWRELQARRFDVWEVSFGVTSNLKYIQGRVGDGSEVSIDYSANKHRMSMEIDRATENNYVTHWWQAWGNLDNRPDIGKLTIQKVVETTLDGASAVIVPAGAGADYFAEQSRRFRIQGLVKPPAKIIGIPQVGEQHVVASRVEITPASSGKVATVSSMVMTSALPRLKT